MSGRLGFTGQSPCAAWMSVWHRPDVSTLTSTSPKPGTGFATSSTLSTFVKYLTTAAFMNDLPLLVLSLGLCDRTELACGGRGPSRGIGWGRQCLASGSAVFW